jgi:dihydroflavonol-4-reductase
MKTLITGANGHIGSNIARRLLDDNREVKAMVREKSDLRGLYGLDVEIVKGDVLDPSSLQKVVKGCDSIYHTAAIVSNTDDDGDLTIRTAVNGTRNLLDAVSGISIDKLVYTSSIATLGAGRSASNLGDESNRNEMAAGQYKNAYTTAKIESEEIASRLGEERDIPIVFVNPSTVLGAYDFKMTPSNRLIYDFLTTGPKFHCRAGGLNIVDVKDVATGHLLAEKKGRIGERYILGGDNISLFKLYRTMSRLTGRRPPYVKLTKSVLMLRASVVELISRLTGKQPGVTREDLQKFPIVYWFFDCTKARKELGYHPIPYRQVLGNAIVWFIEAFDLKITIV